MSRPGSFKAAQVGAGGVFLDGAGVEAGLPGGAVEPLLELADEVLEVVDLMRQVRGALPLRVKRLFGGGLFLLPLVDQHVEAQLLVRECGEVARQFGVFGVDVLAHAQQLGEIAGERIGLRAHLRHHGAEHDRGAHRLQRILGPHHERRRRLPADALQGGEDFDDHGAAFVERGFENMFPLVERLQARLRRRRCWPRRRGRGRRCR